MSALRSKKSTVTDGLYTGKKSSVSSFSTCTTMHSGTEPLKFYVNFCKKYDTVPNKIVLRGIKSNNLDLIADRIKAEDWYPIASMLEKNRTLQRISIRLRTPVKFIISNLDPKTRVNGACMAITTERVLRGVVYAISRCLAITPALTVLELEGIPLEGEFIQTLAQGIIEASTLEHLSLANSCIRDQGVEVVSLAVRSVPNIKTLDLTNCGITQFGAETIAKLISLQKLNRYSETWKQTLRYRDPDIDAMSGLRRLTLNNNTEIGDQGVRLLSQVLQDDLWLRALDLQNTGITDDGAVFLMQLIRCNANLVVVDARGNPSVSPDCLEEITRFLVINNADKMETEYKWMRVEPSKNELATDRRTSSRIASQVQQMPRRTDCILNKNFRQWPGNAPRNPPPSFSSSEPAMSTVSGNPIPTIRMAHPVVSIEEIAAKRENMMLRQQVHELNEILHAEVLQKVHIIGENNQLKEMLERSQMAAKQAEENNNGVLMKQDIVQAIEDTFVQLTSVFEEDDSGDPEFAELVSNMKMILAEICPNKQEHNDLKNLHEESRANGHQVIWEEEEENEDSEKQDRPRRKSRQRKGKESRRQNRRKAQKSSKNLENQEEKAQTEAQRIFAKMIQPTTEDLQNYLSSNSEDDISC